MRSLSASELLDVWEQGLTQLPIQRALTLLEVACPEMPLEALAKLTIGQRDLHLLTLREWLFGSQIQSLATCPACGDRLELCFSVDDIRFVSAPLDVFTLQVSGYDVQFRLPNSLDLVAITSATAPTLPNASSPEQALLNRCLVEASHKGKKRSAKQLPPAVAEKVMQRMAEADPQADIQLDLTCPACGHQWQSMFDIVPFLWTEMNAWAERILLEVHLLASAYGWHEQDILAMSPLRRQLYLEMVQ